MDDLAAMAAADVAVFLNATEHAQSVTYTPEGGAAKAITAIFIRGPERLEDQPDGRAIIATGILWISTDATAGIASPGVHDAVTIGVDTWEIESIDAKSGGMARLSLVKIAHEEKSREDYRISRR